MATNLVKVVPYFPCLPESMSTTTKAIVTVIVGFSVITIIAMVLGFIPLYISSSTATTTTNTTTSNTIKVANGGSISVNNTILSDILQKDASLRTAEEIAQINNLTDTLQSQVSDSLSKTVANFDRITNFGLSKADGTILATATGSARRKRASLLNLFMTYEIILKTFVDMNVLNSTIAAQILQGIQQATIEQYALGEYVPPQTITVELLPPTTTTVTTTPLSTTTTSTTTTTTTTSTTPITQTTSTTTIVATTTTSTTTLTTIISTTVLTTTTSTTTLTPTVTTTTTTTTTTSTTSTISTKSSSDTTTTSATSETSYMPG